jgi:hypothetical protein
VCDGPFADDSCLARVVCVATVYAHGRVQKAVPLSLVFQVFEGPVREKNRKKSVISLRSNSRTRGCTGDLVADSEMGRRPMSKSATPRSGSGLLLPPCLAGRLVRRPHALLALPAAELGREALCAHLQLLRLAAAE